MPLQFIPVSPSVAAEDAARSLITLATNTARQIAFIRANGLSAVAGREARSLSGGQTIPGVAARPAVTGAQIDAVLGAENIAVLDSLAQALGITIDADTLIPAPEAPSPEPIPPIVPNE